MSQDVARPSLADALTERMLELIRAAACAPATGCRPRGSCPSASR
ncbi:hypothetical protein ACFQY7_52285 [Actinomadura luteofluorescens]